MDSELSSPGPRTFQGIMRTPCDIITKYFYKLESNKVSLDALLEIIAKYGVLINEWGDLYYALLEGSMNKITLWKNVHVDDWTVEGVIIASMAKYMFANDEFIINCVHWKV